MWRFEVLMHEFSILVSACGGARFAVAQRRREAFCKGIVGTLASGAVLFCEEKDAKVIRATP